MPSYGDDDVIAQMLGASHPDETLQSDLELRITAMNAVVSDLIDEKTGRTWLGSAPGSSTKTIYPRGFSNVLPLPVPATSISAITVNGTDEGGVVSGGTALNAAYWRVALRNDLDEITAIRMNTGVEWIGYQVVQITGVWAETQNTAPEEIEWVANYVTAERMKQEQANPAGFVGPDGTVTPIRDPWNDSQVKAVIAKWRITSKELVL